MAMLEHHAFSDRGRLAAACILALLASGVICACGGSSTTTVTPPASPAAPSPQTYFAAAVSGAYPGSSISDSEYLSTYIVDDNMHTFSQSVYTFGSGDEKGPQLDYSGDSAAFARGLTQFEITYSNSLYGSSVNAGTGMTYNPPLTGNWFFELANRGGGIVNLKGMPFVPLVAAEQCPTGSKNITYNFVSIPTYIGPSLAGYNGGIQNWTPNEDTAYGAVSVSSAGGGKVTFSSIQQFTASGAQVTDYPDLAGDPPAITSVNGLCSPTFYGNTISVPGEVTVTNPGVGESISGAAIVGIGPSGLLVENNGQTSNLVSNAGLSGYQPFMGSGTGALGLPQPSSQVDVSALSGAQFIGVSYGAGTNKQDWSSLVTSFGFPNQPSGCPTGSFQAPLFGGDYPGDDPTQSPTGGQSGYGNCDVVIDLGSQDPSSNGVFPHATVHMGSKFGTMQPDHSFPATAIAGRLDGKYAVFVIGVDTNGNPQQAWGIYLFQSN